MLLLPPGRRRLPLGVSLWGGEGQQLQQLCWQVRGVPAGSARSLSCLEGLLRVGGRCLLLCR